MFTLLDDYPGDAIGGCDFFSLAARRKISEPGPDGHERRRDERVIVADREISFDDPIQGRICFSEQSVRNLGALVGLLDPLEGDRLHRANVRLRAEADALSAEVIELRAALEGMRGLDQREVFVCPDGSRHASHQAAERHVNPEPAADLPVVAPLAEVTR